MSKHESRPPLAFGSASENSARRRRGGSETAGRPPVLGEIGFVGLGHMGTVMAANLAAAGRRVIAYVRRPDQIGEPPRFRCAIRPAGPVGWVEPFAKPIGQDDERDGFPDYGPGDQLSKRRGHMIGTATKHGVKLIEVSAMLPGGISGGVFSDWPVR
jgi:hypothetical protein